MAVEVLELNSDQRREAVNTTQRFQAWRDARMRHSACRGSMVWAQTKGRDYLLRSAYDLRGVRRQTSLGPRSAGTERIKADFERAKREAKERLDSLTEVLGRQAAVNRALGLGRAPLIGSRIIRALDAHGLLGNGIRVLGTNAIYAYEAAAGVRLDAGLAATEAVDLLLDSRHRLKFIAAETLASASLMRILRRVDKSFERTAQTFRAANKEGYLVDLTKPLREPPWKDEASRLGEDHEDLQAIEIAGLSWHESPPAFEATVIDERGEPFRIVTSDPRVFAIHKFWLSKRQDREPIKRRRDLEQAKAVGWLIAAYMPHLSFEGEHLRMLPKEIVEEAKALFAQVTAESSFRP